MSAKPDLREQFGSAVNASALLLRESQETPLLRVAAMGAAGAAIASGADLAGLSMAASHPVLVAARRAVYLRNTDMRTLMLRPPADNDDPRDTIAGELGPMLWHIRYGGQHQAVPRAVTLFAAWLTLRRTFAGTDPADARLRAFSARVLHEWLSDRCIACGGTKKLERTRQGNLIRPRGSMQRNAVFAVCTACKGTGRQPCGKVERARAIDLRVQVYEEQGWDRRFDMALQWLNKFAHRTKRPLTAELERGKRRP